MDDKLACNIPAMRISKPQHDALTRQAAKNFRTLQDQARFCLSLGLEIEEAGGTEMYIRKKIERSEGVSSYIKKLVRDEFDAHFTERLKPPSKRPKAG